MSGDALFVGLPSFEPFAISGIYFLHLASEIVYVGQAVDVRRRIGDHISEATKRFDAVSMTPCSVAQLNEQERYYIEQLLPRYNNCRYAKSLRLSGVTPSETKPWPAILQRRDVANYLGVSVEALDQLEADGLGPRKSRLPRQRRKVYRLKDVRECAASMACVGD